MYPPGSSAGAAFSAGSSKSQNAARINNNKTRGNPAWQLEVESRSAAGDRGIRTEVKVKFRREADQQNMILMEQELAVEADSNRSQIRATTTG
jgi:hypothetical protein